MGKHHREPIKHTCPDIDKLIKGQNEIMKIIRNYQKIDEVEDLKDIISLYKAERFSLEDFQRVARDAVYYSPTPDSLQKNVDYAIRCIEEV